MEILAPYGGVGCPAAALFDFDGTLSTLRRGWEDVMEPMMLELLSGGQPDDALIAEVRAYIDASTGIQTIHQMKWLAAEVAARRPDAGLPDDPWWYKAEYNRRLMEPVGERLARVQSGIDHPDQYTVAGCRAFLQALRDRGVRICVASGTDDVDVRREADLLGLAAYFDELAGAPAGQESCSKEAVLKRLVDENGLGGSDLVVIGDGRVEIALGSSLGGRCLGLATDEYAGRGVNPVKRRRLAAAGAHAIAGDFLELSEILAWMGF
ncbi:MAG: HAD family hydrolase [Clostridiales bacterium]|nr:HAD family hydrolase [Clostridiales bacterium]